MAARNHQRCCYLAAMCVVVSFAAAGLHAATICVSTAGSDANTGQDWSTAKLTVQAGLNAAAPADQVWVASGTYIENIILKAGVEMYGGFAGTEMALEQRNWVVNRTILDGNQAGSVVAAYSGGAQARIDGFTIRNGKSASGGAGICCYSPSLTIANNTIAGNSTGFIGGGIYLSETSALIANNTIIGNSASNWGGGIYCSSSSATIANNTIAGNNALHGGGIYCASGSPTIVNTIVAFNSSGIYADTGTPSLRFNCAYGNAVYNYSGLTDPTGTNGNLSADPNLADIPYGNAHIQLGSPCIDAGDDSAVQLDWTDVDGQIRKQGDHVDIGADESDGTIWPMGPHAIVRVRPTGNDAHDGSSWPLAKRTVQAGIDAAAALGGEVWVAAGTYVERITLPSFGHVYGGFAGTEAHRSERNASTNTAVLDGSQAGSVVTASTGHRVSTIDGFTIRNGIGTAPWTSYRYGGGVFCFGGSPTIANNTITANSASNRGGGIYGYVASPMVDGNTITNNTAGSAGGIYCESGSPTITNNRIAGNMGSGIDLVVGSRAMILNNTISNNIGGGIGSWSSSVTVANNTITGNRDVDSVSATFGGGIYCHGGTLTLINNTIAGNTANHGGGVYVTNCSLTMANTLVAFNSSGVESSVSTSTLSSNCVYDNTAYNYSGLTDPTGTKGNISVDPRLAWPLYVDVHIQPDSPCVDAGDDSVILEGWTDMDGQARTQKSHVDIGADESDDTVWPSGSGVIVRVSPTGNDAHDGSSWTLAKRTVQAGILAAAPSAGQVWVAAGVYVENISLPRKVSVYAGFRGSETNLSGRNWSAHPTILDGSQAGSVVSAIGLVADLSTLDGFTIRNGNGTVSGSYRHGGGIYCSYASPLITHCTLTGNTATYGGGIYCVYSSPAIQDNILVGNTAASPGGGIYCTYGTPSITNNTITGNTAAAGGGICCSSSAATISNTIVALNSSGIHKGGSPAPSIRYNCVYGNGTNYTGIADQTGINGNLSADPRFVQLAGPGADGTWGTADDIGDLHLPADSPCRNTGDPGFVPAGDETDIDGQPRVMADRVDIGVDEFTWTGDVNLDGYVDVADLLGVVYAFGTVVGDPGFDPACDFNHDGAVDVVDLLDLVYNFGK